MEQQAQRNNQALGMLGGEACTPDNLTWVIVTISDDGAVWGQRGPPIFSYVLVIIHAIRLACKNRSRSGKWPRSRPWLNWRTPLKHIERRSWRRCVQRDMNTNVRLALKLLSF